MDAAATPPPNAGQPAPPDALPSLGQAARVWTRVGVLSFGGPAGQIGLLHREIVELRGWVGERAFLHALSFCALLPGPEAQQLATYLGWLMHGVRGGVVAGGLFVLPGAAVLLGLSILYVELGHVPAIAGLFFGLQCAVLAIVAQAVRRLSARALRTPAARALALAAFVALAVFAVPFPAVVATAAILGACLPGRFGSAAHGGDSQDSPGLFDRARAADPAALRARAASARQAGAAALLLWVAPVAGLQVWLPGRFADIALFFSEMAIVTLGGAYAVLAYVAQDAVHAQHWLTANEMLTGLGLAETTPGPLILTLQFVGFIAGARAPGVLCGLWGGLAGSALTLWVTFVPCFAYVFLGAPSMERLAGNRTLAAALAGVSASVVGVIANLGFWFGVHVLFSSSFTVHGVEIPEFATLRPVSVAVVALAAVLLFALRQSALRTLAICAVVGIAVAEGRQAVLF